MGEVRCSGSRYSLLSGYLQLEDLKVTETVLLKCVLQL